jgi:SAM-dependent methyltransferase
VGSDRLTAHYDRKYGSESAGAGGDWLPDVAHPTNRSEAAVHYILRNFRGGDVLELGAGSGLITRSLLRGGLPCTRYVATDISEARLAGLRRAPLDPRVSVLALDADRIPAEHCGRYDLVVMIALIEHLIDPIGAMRSVRETLRPGGFAYIDTPNIAKYTRRAKLLLGRFPSTASRNEGLTTYEGADADLFDEGHLHYFTFRSLAALLTQRCGFASVVPAGYFHGRQYLGRAVCARLARAWPEMFSDVAVLAYA